MSEQTPAEELLAAATRLTCDHQYTVEPQCTRCGAPLGARQLAGPLAEPLAGLLEEEARQCGLPACDDPRGCCNRCDWNPAAIFVLEIARLINGTTEATT